MKPLIIAAPAMALLLAGCQGFQAQHNDSETVPNPAIVRAIAQQQVLWRENVINNPSELPSDLIQANTELVSVNWSGDAVELLSHVARQRGARFNWVGVRLPLPINLHVKATSYQNLLQLVEMQTAWRATLKQLPGELSLVFAQAQPQAAAGSHP